MLTRILLLTSILLLTIGNAVGAPISVELTGRYYYGLTSDPNFRLLATFQSDQPALNNSIGQYKLDSLSVEFFPPIVGASSLGGSLSSFSLIADPNSSTAYLNLSDSGELDGLRFTGGFASGMNYFPSSVEATTYDISFGFAQINLNQLNSTPLSLQVPYGYASAYIANQIGAYSDIINDPVLLISSVPEPETYAMLMAGLGLLGFMVRRRKKEQS